MPQYLSTDPNAGRYLSTDPNAGETALEAPQTAPELPSTMGFLGNLVSSGMRFGQNVATPFLHPKETVKGLLALTQHPTAAGRAFRDAVAERYGSIDAALKTAYADPVGMASDLSIVFGGVAKGAQLSGAAPRLARTAAMAAEATNPLAVPARVAGAAGRAAYGAAVNPSRRIRRGFPGAMDEGYQQNILPTEGGLERTERALEQSAATTAQRLRDADAAGAPGVDVRRQVIPELAPVQREAGQRFRLGKPDERGDVSARAVALARRNPAATGLAESNTLKQSAQKLADTAFRAQERGAIIKDLDAMADLKVAQAYRKAIETNAASVGVRDIGQSNAKTQALIGLAQALEDATQQPSRLTHLMATLGAVGGTMTGGPHGGALAYTGARLATAKPVMAASGLIVGKGGSAAMRNAQIVRALAVLAAAGPQEQGGEEGERP